MESTQKIQRKLTELNAGLIQAEWVPGPGFHALVTFEYGKNGQPPTFNGNQGMPVKMFFNTSTGEFKVFSAALFLD